MKKRTTSEFIELATKKHNGKYIYDFVEYVDSETKVHIICPIHGVFDQKPNNHLQGQGCLKCKYEEQSKKQLKPIDTLINEFNEVHHFKYDYSKVDYKGENVKIIVICPIHGEFEISPRSHLKGVGCPKCRIKPKKEEKEKRQKRVFDTQSYIEEASKVHDNKYSYDKTVYTKMHDKITVTCPIHGDFVISADKHIRGRGCPKCMDIKKSQDNLKSLEQFIKEANEVHNNRYMYDKTVYTGAENDIIITCPTHGDFTQRAHTHLCGHGCPKCCYSRMENETEKILKEFHINFIAQYRPTWLKEKNIGGGQSIDFFLTDYNIAIECQGIQHYKPVERFGGMKQLIIIKERDERKKRKCEEHNITVEYIKYNDNIRNKIIEILSNVIE